MNNKTRKEEHYSMLKMTLRVITLVIAMWALVVAYQAKQSAEWISDKQDNIIEKLIFDKK